MKAWLLDGQKGIGGLRPGDAPEPAAGEGKVVLDVHFAALNPADRYLAEGLYPAKPKWPHILGRDAVGTAGGQKRLVLRGEAGVNEPGTFAERVAVPVENLAEVPEGWTDEEAAGAALVYCTAYQALTTWGGLPPQGVVLVTGASGGVGVASIQLARAMGHTVVALSRGTSKRDRLIQLGAASVLDPTAADWRKQLKAAGRRVDLAIDNVGGPLFHELIETLADNGRLAVVGRLAGPVPSFNTASLIFRRIRVGGVSVGAYGSAEMRAAWEDVLRLLRKTGAKPLVDSVFPFDQLPQAFARLAEGPMGKVVLRVTSP